jgi:prepilin-type N-terminal cleavage/methylation domain-containing protein
MKRVASDRGFTLVEMTVAIVLLVTGLTTLLGLQSRVLDSYYVEYQRGQAAFFAKYLMTMIEVGAEVPPKSTKEEPLVEALDRTGYFKGLEGSRLKDNLRGWRAVTEASEPSNQLLGALAGAEAAASKNPTTASFTGLVRVQVRVVPAMEPRAAVVLTYYMNLTEGGDESDAEADEDADEL